MIHKQQIAVKLKMAAIITVLFTLIGNGVIGSQAATFSTSPAVTQNNILRVPEDYATIQAAIDAANNGDTVLLNSGRYTGYGNRDLVVTKGIKIKSVGGPDKTIIDAQGSASDPHRIISFNISTLDATEAALDGITMINGWDIHRYGGIILIHSLRHPASKIIINNCVIANNTPENATIRFSTMNGNMLIEKTKIRNNAHIGLQLEGGNVQINDSLIQNNGLAIEANLVNLTINKTKITENNTTGVGGVGAALHYSIYPEEIYYGQKKLTISNSEISNNTGESIIDIYHWAENTTFRGMLETTINDTLIVNNTIPNYGSVLDVMGGELLEGSLPRPDTLLLDNVTISRNRGSMAVIDATDVVFNIFNSLIADNQNFAYILSDLMTRNTWQFDRRIENTTIARNPVTHATIAGNSSDSSDPVGNLRISNSIVNSVDTGTLLRQNNGYHTQISNTDYTGGELIGPVTIENSFSVDPRFVTGPGGNYYLHATSPAINRGNKTSATACSPISSAYCLNNRTTQTNQDLDLSLVDLGYHYKVSAK